MASDSSPAGNLSAYEVGSEGEASLGSALLGRAAVLIWNDVAPEGRARFYDWHDREHIAERLALPGFRRGRRFIRFGHSPEWLTMYEADDVSALVSPAYIARLNSPTPATAATLPHFRNTSRAVCNVAQSIGSSTGGHVLAMRLAVDGADVQKMCDYLKDDAFPRVMERTGVVACHLFRADSSASYVNTAESSTRQFDVPAWVLLCEASLSSAALEAANVFVDGRFSQLDIGVREDFAVYSLEICHLSTPNERPVRCQN